MTDFRRGLDDTGKDYTTARNRAQQAEQRALGDMATDFGTARQRSIEGQHRALGDMSADYQKMIRRSGQDLATAMREIYGSFGTVFGNSMHMVTSQIGKYAPSAARLIAAQLNSLKTQFPQLFDPTYLGQAAPPSDATRGGPSGEHSGPGHALGGISTRHHLAEFSEGNRAEAIIPLDHRGQTYMTGMYYAIARSVVQQMNTSRHPALPTRSVAPVHQDYSTTYTGEIHVHANDPNKLVAELAKKARMAKLSRPARATATA